jgi:hypothetical protein
MRIGSSLLVDMSLGRPSVIDQLRGQLAGGQVKSGRVLGEASRGLSVLGGLGDIHVPPPPEMGSVTAQMISGQLVIDFPSDRSSGEAPRPIPVVRSNAPRLDEWGCPRSKLAATYAIRSGGRFAQCRTPQCSTHARSGPRLKPLLAFLIRANSVALPSDGGGIYVSDEKTLPACRIWWPNSVRWRRTCRIGSLLPL